MTKTDAANFASTTRSEEMLVLQRQAGLPDQYLDDLQDHIAPLAAALQDCVKTAGRPILVGLNGCQGSGKSTLARFLVKMLHIGAGLRCAVVSIDDFYLKKSARQQLARDVHPLLITRGVPGTHDLPLANRTLDALLDRTRSTTVQVPVFNKATDDRELPGVWPAVAPGVDLVILEGWCVGCTPEQPGSLSDPVNALERDEDANNVWRDFVNTALASDYRLLFERLDVLVMLAAPSFDCVYDWRRQQEDQLLESLTKRNEPAQQSSLLFGQALRRFIQHYERLTRHQLNTLPKHADGVIQLAADHRMAGHSGSLFS